MTDIRESILSRLHTIAQTVLPAAKRMDFDVAIEHQPCLVLVDGEEDIQVADPFAHSSDAPIKVQMNPHFALMIQTSNTAGPTLSAVRADLVKAVLSDAQLAELTGYQSGARKIGARYVGCDTGVQMGEGLIAFMTLRFAVMYHLKSNDL